MLTLIHGSDTALSRKYFLEEKEKMKDAVLLEADGVNLTDLAQIFEGGGLFGETKYLFIEQLLTKKKKSADLTSILTYLEKNAGEHTIIIWEGKELDRSSLTLLKTATVKIFKLPQTLFQFLDAFVPENGKTLIKLFHQTIETSEAEMVFFMIVRQVRILLALSPHMSLREAQPRSNPNEIAMLPSVTRNDDNQIEELKRLAPWQKSKLEKQANQFKPESLLNLYDKLFQLEVGQKTGTLTMPLASAIDFFLAEV
jgi:hypothetical protein